ncbi:PTS glucitol/sorbitol transporter subunit IIA [Candidatus Aquiluna sp. UB-MaderosW2red]|uniref:PTS glucitol/sorbitol transporter subunit IIA n=1 Tax=Candidatus Aquiluna sp. UB-MaderosW2red TaxID=1855377 RepID=UPI000875C328|nr:PTS glucitol/sorbitol transporter subunit IIA [Candidatus Aquiluna sp. UB-MaderosW2red]SCX06063.1 PTS system, glucitol/sorbitol-specific IIA component [Candidatus Aquiluna sp. UB-MaderosW2red]
MAELLYRSEVTGIGDLVSSFVAEGILVFFGESAPEELHEFCIMHKVEHQSGVLNVGDVIQIDEYHLEVLALGSVANENLMNLGHMNIKADGNLIAEMPGDVCVAIGELPPVAVGSKIQIIRK